MKSGGAFVNTVTNLRVPQTEIYFLAITEEMVYYQEWLHSTKFNHLRSRTDRFWRPHGLHFTRYRSYFLGVKQPERDVYHSPSSSVQVKSDYSYTSTPLCAFMSCRGEVTCICLLYRAFHNVLRDYKHL
jgi:hypothetical protein